MEQRARRVVACAMAALAVVFAATTSAIAAEPSRSLDVGGAVAHPTTWTVATLQSLPQLDVTLPAADGRPRVYHGVLLRDVVRAAEPLEPGKLDLRQSIVVARATDGYLAVFAWIELVATPTGDGVVVAWSRDGVPLGDDEGAFALVSARDTDPRPRHVRWLESITLKRVVP